MFDNAENPNKVSIMNKFNQMRVMIFGANPDKETRAKATHPITKERCSPIRATRIPQGSPMAAVTISGSATNNPAVVRLMP